jgi:hypothetical protein
MKDQQCAHLTRCHSKATGQGTSSVRTSLDARSISLLAQMCTCLAQFSWSERLAHTLSLSVLLSVHISYAEHNAMHNAKHIETTPSVSQSELHR